MFSPGIIEYSTVAADPLIMEWTVAGNVAARTVTLPLSTYVGLTVNWGDGNTTTGIGVHVYALDGVYQTRMSGNMGTWSFNNGGDKLKLTDIITWGTAPTVTVGNINTGFYGCTNLRSIGTGPIPVLTPTALVRFVNSFRDCVLITSIPSGLFDNFNSGFSSDVFNGTFRGCTALSSIPVDLFRYTIPTGTPNTSIFSATFQECSSLVSIPTDLFRYHIKMTDQCFNGTFRDCTSLASIPTDLFRYNTLINFGGFGNTFSGCSSLVTIPANLFDYNISAKIFAFTFRGCTSLETVPNYLFRYNTGPAGQSLGFGSTFAGCIKMQQNEWIFWAPGEEATRFPVGYDFSNCFDRASFTGIQGTAPQLWLYAGGVPGKTDCWNGAGNSLTSLSNYASIPAAWK